MTCTTQKQIRAAFWQAHPGLAADARRARKLTAGQNAQDAGTRAAFIDFLDYLHRAGQISDALAQRATL